MPATFRPATLAAAVTVLLAAGAAPAAAQGVSWGQKLKGIIKEQAATRIERRLAEETGRGTEKAMDASVSAMKCLAGETTCRAAAAAAAPGATAARDTVRGAGSSAARADSAVQGARGAGGPAAALGVPAVTPAATPAATPVAPAAPRRPAQASSRD